MYGGTKTEMERLIADANKLRIAQGKAGDLTIEKYSDVIEAIHEVQTQMGITGTTAQEAMTTISGSMNATKAAWKNLLIAFATGNKRDMKQAMDGMVSSAKNVVKNVVPVVSTALTSLSEFIGEIAPVVAQELPGIITETVPSFLKAVGSLAGSLVSNFPAMISGLGSAVAEAITGDKNADFGRVAQAIIDGISAKAKDLAEAVKGAITGDKNASWGEVGTAIIKGIQEKAASILDEAKKALGLSKDASWPEVGEAIINGIKNAIADISTLFFGEDGPDWVNIGDTIVNKIAEGITGAGNIISGLLEGIFNALNSPGTDLDFIAIAGSIISKLIEYLGKLGSSLYSAGEQIITSIASGIADAIPGLEGNVDSVKAAIDGILGALVAMKLSVTLINIGKSFETLFATIAAAAGGLNPVILVIGLLVGVIIYLWNKSEAFRNVVGAIWDGIVEGIGKAVNKAAEWINTLKESVEKAIAFLKDPFGEWENRDVISTPITIRPEVFLDHPELKETLSEEDWQALIGDAPPLDLTVGFVPDEESYQQFVGQINDLGLELENSLESGGKTGGDNAADAVESAIKSASEIAASNMESNLESSGKTAANSIGAQVQSSLNGTKLPDYVANVNIVYHETENGGSYGRGRVKKNASAMNTGRIFTRPTIFGYADGAYQVAGDAGPEAVVGVSSLRDMIRDAVGDQLGAILNGMSDLRAGQNQGELQVVLDTGALVGGMARKMDEKLYDITAWKGGGRA